MADPDEPTRRLPPTEPPRPVRERTVVTEEPEPAWEAVNFDRLRSLRTAVVLVGIIALAALGVAVWALISELNEGDGRRNASAARVAELSDRVDQLESQVRDTASEDALAGIRDREKQLDDRLSTLEKESGGDALSSLQNDVAQVGDSVDQLDQRIEQLEQRVDELEQQQSTAP